MTLKGFISTRVRALGISNAIKLPITWVGRLVRPHTTYIKLLNTIRSIETPLRTNVQKMPERAEKAKKMQVRDWSLNVSYKQTL